ncbi:hypothetical protein ACVXG7_30340 [Enterobacter hormaechei]
MVGKTARHVTSINPDRRHRLRAGFREQQYCGADAVRYIDGTSPVDGNEFRRICDASQNPAFASAPTYKLQFWVVFYKIPTTSPMPDDNANSRGAKCRIADIAGEKIKPAPPTWRHQYRFISPASPSGVPAVQWALAAFLFPWGA